MDIKIEVCPIGMSDCFHLIQFGVYFISGKVVAKSDDELLRGLSIRGLF